MMTMRTIVFSLLLFLFGCNSHIPTLINTPPDYELGYKQVKNNTKNYQDQYVRWGGKIVSVENKENSTWVEILANPLNSFGRPILRDDYQGRFIARIDGFLEPEQYSKDRYLTIYGKVETNVTRHVDEYPYNYPLIYAQEHHLWSKQRTAQYYDPDYYGYYPRIYHPNYRYPYSRFHSGFYNPYW
jgi:outer membrane lipoprotein